MDQQKQIELLRASLTCALTVLDQVHGYAIMTPYMVSRVKDALNDAESTLQLTDYTSL